MNASSGLDRPHLNLKTIQRLTRFAFVPRRFLDGRFTGRHASPQRGQSVEFRDFRQYLPGDDVGQIDWKVFGRSDKLYVRLFEHETELRVTFIVDGSSSMAYGSETHGRKYDHACRLAAALAFVVMQARDRAGFGLACRGLQCYQKPAAAMPQLVQMLDTMQREKPTGVAALSATLDQLAGHLQRGEIVIVFSDVWEDLDDFFRAVGQINHVGAEVILFHILHPDELHLPPDNDAVLVDSETGEYLRVNLPEVRDAYRRRLDHYLEQLRSRCRQFDVEYQFAPLSEPFQQTLERYLVRRCT